MATTDNNTQLRQTEQQANRSLLITMAVIVIATAIVAIIGFCLMNKPAEIIEGQVEGTSVRISGKLPGRVVEFYVREGDTVHAGDTLVCIHSSLVEAKLMQAEAMQTVASSQNRKVDAGTRSQIIGSARSLWQQAQAAAAITKKTYDRMERLYSEGVISEQKRDEAKAAYDAAVAAENAAKSQYDLAVSGAQSEDKQAAAAMVDAARGSVEEVQALLADAYLTTPCDGTIDRIYPEVGELVSLGAPIMSVLRTDDRYIVFNVREDMLEDMPVGNKIRVMIPALGEKEFDAEIYYVRDMGSYAMWRATKATGTWDSRTFEVKARPTEKIRNLRPGMSVIYMR